MLASFCLLFFSSKITYVLHHVTNRRMEISSLWSRPPSNCYRETYSTIQQHSMEDQFFKLLVHYRTHTPHFWQKHLQNNGRNETRCTIRSGGGHLSFYNTHRPAMNRRGVLAWGRKLTRMEKSSYGKEDSRWFAHCPSLLSLHLRLKSRGRCGGFPAASRTSEAKVGVFGGTSFPHNFPYD